MSETSDDRALLPFDDGSGEGVSRLVRRQWHDGRWFFSVVDVIAVLTDTETPRRYWSDLKRKIQDDEGFSELRENRTTEDALHGRQEVRD